MSDLGSLAKHAPADRYVHISDELRRALTAMRVVAMALGNRETAQIGYIEDCVDLLLDAMDVVDRARDIAEDHLTNLGEAASAIKPS